MEKNRVVPGSGVIVLRAVVSQGRYIECKVTLPKVENQSGYFETALLCAGSL